MANTENIEKLKRRLGRDLQHVERCAEEVRTAQYFHKCALEIFRRTEDALNKLETANPGPTPDIQRGERNRMSVDIYPAVSCPFCHRQREGAHYNIWVISKGGAKGLREMFPDANANEMNFVLFSTSGVHGTYTTIEQIEQSLTKYGADPEFLKDENEERIPDDWHGNSLTVTVYHPRIIGISYGNVEVTLEDIPFLKQLRQSSWDAVQTIGRGEATDGRG